jgi:pyrroline-5-carboxylate reductase
MKRGPIIVSPSDRALKKFFNHLGKVFEVKNENLSKAFWSTSSFMASYYYLLFTTSNWLVSKGIKKNEADNYSRELFLALSEDAIHKKKLPLKKLVVDSQTPGGTNSIVLNKLKENKFYLAQKKALNSIFKKF